MGLPTQMIDRWATRAEPSPAEGTIYWHMLLGGDPTVREMAADAQSRLSGFSGLHMTPLQWLHMTTLVVGPSEEISASVRDDMLRAATERLAKIEPVSVSIGRVLYHPQAIMLGVHPAEALEPVFHAIQSATEDVTGRKGTTTSSGDHWLPHMTLCYSTAEQPAGPLIEALGRSLPERSITIDTVTLVDQRGAERSWNWERMGAVRLCS